MNLANFLMVMMGCRLEVVNGIDWCFLSPFSSRGCERRALTLFMSIFPHFGKNNGARRCLKTHIGVCLCWFLFRLVAHPFLKANESKVGPQRNVNVDAIRNKSVNLTVMMFMHCRQRRLQRLWTVPTQTGSETFLKGLSVKWPQRSF